MSISEGHVSRGEVTPVGPSAGRGRRADGNHRAAVRAALAGGVGSRLLPASLSAAPESRARCGSGGGCRFWGRGGRLAQGLLLPQGCVWGACSLLGPQG